MYNEKVEVSHMKEEFVVTNEYLSKKGLDLNDYALEGTLISAIIELGLDLVVDRICYLDDDVSGESDIEKYLEEHQDKVDSFFKAQYRSIYNLIFQAETNPMDTFLDYIIVHQLGLGKINGWQKGIYHRHDR